MLYCIIIQVTIYNTAELKYVTCSTTDLTSINFTLFAIREAESEFI